MNRKLKTFFIVLLALSMIALIPGQTEATEKNNDITDRVTLEGITILSKHGNSDWEPIESGATLAEGMTLKLNINWSISELNMVGVETGDYFVIPVDPNHMELGNTDYQELNDGSGTAIGKWRIENNSIEAILNETGAEALYLEKGFFNVFFVIYGEGKDIELIIAGEKLPPINIVDNGTDPNDYPVGSLPKFEKSGGQIGYTKDAAWTISVNQDELLRLYKDQSTILQTMNDVMLIDELPPTFQFIADSIEVVSYVPFPYDSSGTGTQVTDMKAGEPMFARVFTQDFNRVVSDVGETQAAFHDRVRYASTPTIGIYENRILMVSFGKLPHDGNAFKYFESDSLLRDFLSGQDISDMQQEIMFNMLASTGQLNGKANNFRVRFRMTSDNETQISDIENTAKLIYNTIDSEEGNGIVIYQWQNAGVDLGEPQSVKLIKYDDGSGEVLAGVGFKLQTWSAEQNDYVDYTTPNESLIEDTNDQGVVTFTKLKVGKYRIVEVSTLPGYTDKVTFEPESNQFEVIGKETGAINYKAYNFKEKQTLIDINGEKKWDDTNNQEGKRPETITIKLLADGEVVKTQSVDANSNWTFSFENLNKFLNGKEVIYTIEEVSVPGYTSIISGNPSEGFRVVNSRIPETVKLSVEKQWVDNNNTDGKRPESIEINLLADGVVVKTQSISASMDWKFSFENLDKFANGKEVMYSIKEVPVLGYTSSISGNLSDGFTIVNSRLPETVNVSVEKEWQDNNNSDGKRPASITIKLLADGVVVKTQSVSANMAWTFSFENLDKFVNGKEVIYSIEEVPVLGYNSVISGNPSVGFKIVNSNTSETINLKGEKQWIDNNNSDGKRPASITIKLLADGVVVKTQRVSVNMDWKFSFENLDKFKNGKEVIYTLEEVPVLEYTSVISGNASEGFKVVNSRVSETVDLSGEKRWVDNNNEDGTRPESISISLIANGVKVQTIEVSAKDKWKFSFWSLEKYNNGKEISYRIEEAPIRGYTSKVNGNITDGFVVENTKKPKENLPKTGYSNDSLNPSAMLLILTGIAFLSGDLLVRQSKKRYLKL